MPTLAPVPTPPFPPDDRATIDFPGDDLERRRAQARTTGRDTPDREVVADRDPAGRDAADRVDPDRHGLTAWVARLAVDDAARERSQAHWLRQQAREEGTFAGVLADLADRGRPLLVQLRNGRLHRGRVTVVGADFVTLGRSSGHDVLVAFSGIASVRTQPGEAPTAGDRAVQSRTTLAETLSALSEERVRILVLGADPAQPVAGELRSVGRDVLTIRLDGGGLAYVAVTSVAEVSLAVSG